MDWIPVDEKLPVEDGSYLVTQERYLLTGKKVSKITTIAQFIKGYWNRGEGFRITAWMPLPETYEGRERSEATEETDISTEKVNV